MFRGVTHLALDNKGRLAIPAKHREALLTRADGHMVLTADPSHCLLLYPFPEWEPIQKRLMALRASTKKFARCSVCSWVMPTMWISMARDASWCLRRCASSRRSTSAWCWSGRATSSSFGTRRNGTERTAQAVAFPAGGLPPELDGFSL